MTHDDNAAQTRKSYLESIKGKAKEVAGAVTGNDSLTAEGQLEQTQARERRQASSDAAEADAKATEAHVHATEAELEGAKERLATEVRTAGAEGDVRSRQAADKAAAEVSGHHEAERAQTQFEAEVQREAERAKAEERAEIRESTEEYEAAVDDYNQSVGEAVRAEAEADRLRRRAEGADDPTLP